MSTFDRTTWLEEILAEMRDRPEADRPDLVVATVLSNGGARLIAILGEAAGPQYSTVAFIRAAFRRVGKVLPGSLIVERRPYLDAMRAYFELEPEYRVNATTLSRFDSRRKP